MSSPLHPPAEQKIVLASGSPRRRELLARLVPSFEVLSSPVEEQGDDRVPDWQWDAIVLPEPFRVRPESDPRLWAWRKAVDVIDQNQSRLSQGTLVLGADTIVVASDGILGKPATVQDAHDMLYRLRGRKHYVATGFVLVRMEREGPVTVHYDVVTAQVVMRAFTPVEVEDYVATGEPMDKAGAYALQGLGGRLVERVEGCRTTVVGLPVCRVRAALGAAGAVLLPYPAGGYCPFCPRQVSSH